METRKLYICPECEVMDSIDDICDELPTISKVQGNSASGNGDTDATAPDFGNDNGEADAKGNNGFNMWDDEDY